MEPLHGELNHTRFNLGQIQNVVDEVEETIGTGFDNVDVLQLLSIEGTV